MSNTNKMKVTRYIGVWMDHDSARLMEIVAGPLVPLTIKSTFDSDVKEQSVEKSEKGMHNRENHEQATYYKAIGKELLPFDDILLFGPTAAKSELFNLLKADHHFDHIKIETRQTDKMTQNQEHAFVREYFANR